MRLAFAGFPEPVTSWVYNNRAIPSGRVKVVNDFFVLNYFKNKTILNKSFTRRKQNLRMDFEII